MPYSRLEYRLDVLCLAEDVALIYLIDDLD